MGLNRRGGVRAAQILVEGIRAAFESLGAHRIRAGLTILGVTIGVMVVVTMAAMITGIRTSVLEGFEAAGPRNLMVTRFDMTDVRLVSDGTGRPPWWNMPRITTEEVARIAELPGIREALVSFDFSTSISYRGRRITGIQSTATGAGWPAYNIGTFVAGRNFTQTEVRQSRAVVVVSLPLAEELFGPLDPIGRRVRISGGQAVNELFTVVGVYDLGDNIFADAVRYLAVYPHTAATKTLQADNSFQSILVVPQDTVSRQAVIDGITGALRSARSLGPVESNNFAVIESEQLVALFNQITGVFFLVMIALSSVALLVGGVGVVGIMMISVTERTREIGIRKAVGATRVEILIQFLIEASLLTLVGGGLGLALGAGVANVLESVTPIPAQIPFWSVLAALAMAVVTGVLFGLAPAVRAANLDPVASLRYE